MTTETKTYYHVTGSTWTPGDDLLCWDRLTEQGLATADDWKWEDAEVGFDGDVVCLFATREEAEEYMDVFGGDQLLRVTIPADCKEYGVTMTKVEEGYPAVLGAIPGELVEVAR